METLKTKNTTELLRDLKHTKLLNTFLQRDRQFLRNESFTEEFNRIYLEQKEKKAVLARRCSVSEVYFHQILAGSRVPSRNRLLCLCLGLELDLETSNHLLRLCGYAPLYARDSRDAIILHGLLHHTSIQKVNENLFENKENPILI